jgi:DNA-binding beta-propeller fold protein YncE
MALLACAVMAVGAAAPAHAERLLVSQKLLETDGTLHPPGSQVEGACGLAVSPGQSLYVSDYYQRVVDAFALGGAFQFTAVTLGGTSPVFGIDSVDAVCGLAFDASGTLYANEFHEGVLRLKPTVATIDEGESTGVAVDPATGDLYVNDRTYVAEYEAPVEPGDLPVAKIGEGSLDDAYGLAIFGGRVYVPDAGKDAVQVFEPAKDPTAPEATIEHSFVSLVDAAVAVDPTNEHLLVVDNAQPGYEHPVADVYEFAADGAFLGALSRPFKSGMPTGPVFGEPSGIAVDPGTGNVFVTDGNSELANVFEYGPYTQPMSPGAASSLGGGEEGRASASGNPPRVQSADASGRGAARRNHASPSVAVQRGPVRVSVEGKLTPHTLPRRGAAPVGISIAARIDSTGKGSPPQLRRIAIEINRNGHFDTSGLPSCSESQIQPSTTEGALSACRRALVGEGHFSANIKLPEQSPFPSQGKILAFNGRVHGKPAILAHIYGTEPAPTSYVLPFLIRSTHGTYGNVLETSLPQATGNWGYVTGLRMNLHRTFRQGGARRSYLSAGCPAPPGFSAAVFPLARTEFAFAGGMKLATVLERDCRARG